MLSTLWSLPTPGMLSMLWSLPLACRAQEAERTTEFLWAASQGAEAKVRQMLQAGTQPDCADYGEWQGSTAAGRCCLM